MSKAVEALKKAVELEKMALESYKEAAQNATHKETREFIEKVVSERSQQVDSLHWMIMAEAGQLEKEDMPREAEAEEAKPAAGKCPFSGQLAEMGIDISKMGKEMFGEDPHS